MRLRHAAAAAAALLALTKLLLLVLLLASRYQRHLHVNYTIGFCWLLFYIFKLFANSL